jgi:hypothetical protein
MEMEDFPKFQDVVVGLQRDQESHTEYHAFQLKGYNDKMGTNVKTICSTDVIPDLKDIVRAKGVLTTIAYILKTTCFTFVK